MKLVSALASPSSAHSISSLCFSTSCACDSPAARVDMTRSLIITGQVPIDHLIGVPTLPGAILGRVIHMIAAIFATATP
jgi:hypothetical protein